MTWLLPEAGGVATALRLFIDFLGLMAAAATGRSFAASWSPFWLIAPAMLALAAALQFLHFALFQETLVSLYYYSVTFLVVLIGAALGYRSKRALQMGSQYRWMFHSEGMFWRERPQH
jgi:hypothetical protein